MSLRRTKARSRESYFLGLPFDSRRTQEMQRSTSIAMINSVYDSLGKVQIQLVYTRMDQWIWHHFLLVQLQTHSLDFIRAECVAINVFALQCKTIT